MQNTFDAVIVGAGAIGTWVSKRLTEGGLQIALIEAGPALDLARDFVPDTTPQDEGPGREVQSQAGACSGIRRRFFVNDRDNPYTAPPDKPFLWRCDQLASGARDSTGRRDAQCLRWEPQRTRRGDPTSPHVPAPHDPSARARSRGYPRHPLARAYADRAAPPAGAAAVASLIKERLADEADC
jgi:choline dehydrogenase-like flavoprotein